MRDITSPKNGNYANLSTLLKKYRKSGDVLFIFGGDAMGPSLISNMDKGAHIINILNMLSPDVYGVCNSDFMFSADELSLRAEEAYFPFVLSNVTYENNETIPNILQRLLIVKGNCKIGIISVLDDRAKARFKTGEISIESYKKSVLKNSKILRNHGAEMVILLTTGYSNVSNELFDKKAIDLVLSKYQNSPKINNDKVINLYDLDKVAIISVSKDEKGFKFDVKKESLLDFKGDNSVDALINEYAVKINSFLGQKIGVTKVPLNTKRDKVRTQENAFANLLADSIREYVLADIALVNGGAIRGNRSYPKDTVLTRKDILTELPFKDEIVFVEINGQKILDIFEYALGDKNDGWGGFLHIAGGKVIYNTALKPGKRVVDLFIDNQKIKKDKKYHLATIDFLYDGGDGFTMFKDSKRIKKHKLDYRVLPNILTDYIIDKKNVKPRIEGRLIDLNKNKVK